MAGTVTLNVENRKLTECGKLVQRLVFDWTSTAGGAADLAFSLKGFILKMVTDPTDGPTDNYDITLIDEDGADVLIAQGADRDTTNTETVYPAQSNGAIPVFHAGNVTFTVANAGNAKSGRAIFWVVESLR